LPSLRRISHWFLAFIPSRFHGMHGMWIVGHLNIWDHPKSYFIVWRWITKEYILILVMIPITQYKEFVLFPSNSNQVIIYILTMSWHLYKVLGRTCFEFQLWRIRDLQWSLRTNKSSSYRRNPTYMHLRKYGLEKINFKCCEVNMFKPCYMTMTTYSASFGTRGWATYIIGNFLL